MSTGNKWNDKVYKDLMSINKNASSLAHLIPYISFGTDAEKDAFSAYLSRVCTHINGHKPLKSISAKVQRKSSYSEQKSRMWEKVTDYFDSMSDDIVLKLKLEVERVLPQLNSLDLDSSNEVAAATLERMSELKKESHILVNLVSFMYGKMVSFYKAKGFALEDVGPFMRIESPELVRKYFRYYRKIMLVPVLIGFVSFTHQTADCVTEKQLETYIGSGDKGVKIMNLSASFKIRDGTAIQLAKNLDVQNDDIDKPLRAVSNDFVDEVDYHVTKVAVNDDECDDSSLSIPTDDVKEECDVSSIGVPTDGESEDAEDM